MNREKTPEEVIQKRDRIFTLMAEEMVNGVSQKRAYELIDMAILIKGVIDASLVDEYKPDIGFNLLEKIERGDFK